MEKNINSIKDFAHMTYTSEISPVLREWKERLNNSGNSKDYKIALGECIHDLESTVDKSLLQQATNDNYYS